MGRGRAPPNAIQSRAPIVRRARPNAQVSTKKKNGPRPIFSRQRGFGLRDMWQPNKASHAARGLRCKACGPIHAKSV
eukprot:74094-Pyramimonas_sp.AAC.1